MSDLEQFVTEATMGDECALCHDPIRPRQRVFVGVHGLLCDRHGDEAHMLARCDLTASGTHKQDVTLDLGEPVHIGQVVHLAAGVWQAFPPGLPRQAAPTHDEAVLALIAEHKALRKWHSEVEAIADRIESKLAKVCEDCHERPAEKRPTWTRQWGHKYLCSSCVQGY